MNKEYINVDETINKAIKEAIKTFDKEKMEERKKNVFHNTKLLLKYYNDLKEHIKNAIDDINKLKNNELRHSEYFDVEKGTDELYILSIKRSKTKTLIMVSHIDMAMEMLKNKQYKLGTIERYLALEKYYKDGESYEDIAEDLNCSVITSKRWVKEMTNELGIFLFGIDGMKLDMIQ